METITISQGHRQAKCIALSGCVLEGLLDVLCILNGCFRVCLLGV